MLKKYRIILALLCALCLLPVAGSTAEPSIRSVRTVVGRIKQGSIAMLGSVQLLPEDVSGFELLISPDLPDGYLNDIIPGLPAPAAGGDSGLLHCPLDAETIVRMANDSYTASISPDGAVLWFMYGFPRPFMAVQRGKAFLLMAPTGLRGVPDADGALKDVLDRKLKIATDPVEGEVRWSPDGRWLFFNDTELWRGTEMKLNDPYLADTLTGDIFLLENSGSPKDPLKGTFRCVMNGRFSLDGKSFFWYCRSYAGGSPAHSLMRYDLESGAQETVCELEYAVTDFCEVTENRFFLLEASGSGPLLARLTILPDGNEWSEEPLPSFCSSAVFLPAVRGNVLLAATPRPSGGTYLLPLAWDTPAASASWHKISSIHGALQPISEADVEAELDAAKHAKVSLSGSENIGTANLSHAAAIIGTTDLMLTVFIRDPVPDSWGGGFHDFTGQILLDTESLELFPIETAYLDGLQDSLIDGEFFLEKDFGGEAYGLYSLYEFPELQFQAGEYYSSPYGAFTCRSAEDPLAFTSVSLENRECTADVTPAGDGYAIRFRVTEYPEPETVRQEFAVPEVLTADRMAEVTSAMGKSDQKKVSGLYTKIAPDKLEKRDDRDEILAAYPAAASETLYILKSGNRTSSLAAAETALKAAGYTAEDLERDMALAAVPRETNVVITKSGTSRTFPVRYSFIFSDPGQYPGSARIMELTSLCEQIARAVMENRALEEPLPVESVISDMYDLRSIYYYVTVDRAEEDGGTLEISLTVTP